ncbi:MAG: winged helix-turn-helix transcriptional regulator [Candidatus Woesearchaeota archaeon]
MVRLDKQEVEIVRQLVLDPRISDNQISKNAKIPLKSVNRKRKNLEAKGLLYYFTYLDTSSTGTGAFGARDMYIIKLRLGITRKEFIEKIMGLESNYLKQKHVLASAVGEYEGRLAFVMIIESRLATDIMEIFNAEFVPELNKVFGAGAIDKVITIRLDTILRLLHNYIPPVNMKAGYIIKEWGHKNVFVDDID